MKNTTPLTFLLVVVLIATVLALILRLPAWTPVGHATAAALLSVFLWLVGERAGPRVLMYLAFKKGVPPKRCEAVARCARANWDPKDGMGPMPYANAIFLTLVGAIFSGITFIAASISAGSIAGFRVDEMVGVDVREDAAYFSSIRDEYGLGTLVLPVVLFIAGLIRLRLIREAGAAMSVILWADWQEKAWPLVCSSVLDVSPELARDRVFVLYASNLALSVVVAIAGYDIQEKTLTRVKLTEKSSVLSLWKPHLRESSIRVARASLFGAMLWTIVLQVWTMKQREASAMGASCDRELVSVTTGGGASRQPLREPCRTSESACKAQNASNAAKVQIQSAFKPDK